MTAPHRLPALPVHPLPAALPAPADWRLRIDGLVTTPLALTIDALAALAPVQRVDDFACTEGWVVKDLCWEGVPVAAVLALAGPQPAGGWLQIGAGEFTVSMPLAEARDGALLAYRLDGVPLAPAHGAPLRLIAPGRACYYSIKWVDHLAVLAEDTPTTGQAIASARLSGNR